MLGHTVGGSVERAYRRTDFLGQRRSLLNRVFEENMVTNFESLFGTWFVDTCVYERQGTRFMSKVPLALLAV